MLIKCECVFTSTGEKMTIYNELMKNLMKDYKKA